MPNHRFNFQVELANVMHPVLLLIIGMTHLALGQTLVGYDCGGRGLNISRLSLMDVDECNINIPTVNVTIQPAVLLQTKKYIPVQVTQCKVQIHRVITDCGKITSYSGQVNGGYLDYLDEVTREQCMSMHATRVTKIGHSTLIAGSERNGTVYNSVTLAGRVSTDGSCSGVTYNDYMVSYSSVVVQASVTITLTDYTARTDREKDVIFLNSGVQCKFSKLACVDNAGGHTFWDNVHLDDWKLEKFDVLWKGYAVKTIDPEDPKRPMYTVKSAATSFAILTEGYANINGRDLMKTEHHRLFLLETREYDTSIPEPGTPLAENISFFTYVNAKIVYVERFIRKQMKSLYHDVLYHKCILERKVLKNLLSLASIKPDEFAYNLMDGPEHMAVVTGEIARIVKCVPVEVTLRRPETCYLELPVTRGNSSYFLTPKTHILTRRGTEVMCDGTIPTTYRIGGIWYEITPEPHRIEAPEMLKPATSLTWKYEDTGSLANTGIYSPQELDNLEERVLFSHDQQAVLNIVAHTAAGRKVVTQGVSIEHLFDEAMVDKIVDSYWSRAWSKFYMFGNTVAGCLGIFVLCRVLKFLIDTIFHACLLKRTFGWSFKLVGAIFSSITHFLIHSFEETKNEEAKPAECIPLQLEEVKTVKSTSKTKFGEPTPSPRIFSDTIP